MSQFHENVHRNQETDKRLDEAHNHITQMQQQLTAKEDIIKQVSTKYRETNHS